jgi:hypothetical protein
MLLALISIRKLEKDVYYGKDSPNPGRSFSSFAMFLDKNSIVPGT